MKAAVYFCTSLSVLSPLPPLKHIHLAVTKGWVMSPPMGTTVIVVLVNGTPQLRETAFVQAATAGRSPRDKPSKILAQLTHSLSRPPSRFLFPLLPFHGLCDLGAPAPSKTPPKKRLTKPKREPFVSLRSKKEKFRKRSR